MSIHPVACTCQGSLALSARRSRLRVIEGGRGVLPRGPWSACGTASRPSMVAVACAAVLSVTLLAGTWILSDALSASRLEARLAQAPVMTVTVLPGDTLWGIAEAHPVAGCTTGELVAAIGRINGLRAGHLVAGTVLDVPCSR
ncbi:MAG: LysM peptidoglycan-binding domain-containing protein [Acidobacteriota bacterium]|nr:LysM peptidoglycan-binding domain-containing protein [Acidobacteriota bacterium]